MEESAAYSRACSRAGVCLCVCLLHAMLRMSCAAGRCVCGLLASTVVCASSDRMCAWLVWWICLWVVQVHAVSVLGDGRECCTCAVQIILYCIVLYCVVSDRQRQTIF